MPIVSLVVPIYNVEPFLSQCLASLPEDDGVEVILVNDGATDGSGEIIREYRRAHPSVVVVEKENGGLSDARNAGVAVASGDWVYFLDGDDRLAPGAVQTLLDFARRERCDIVQGNFYYAYDDRLLYDARRPERTVLSRDEAMTALVAQDTVKNFAWGKLYRAELAKAHPFHKGVYFEDAYWQHLMIDGATRYGIVATPLYYYRQRAASISGTFSVRNLDLLRGYEERLAFLQARYPFLEKAQAASLWRLAEQFCLLARRQGDASVQEACQCYWDELCRTYEPVFAYALRWSALYNARQYAPSLLPVVRLAERIRNRITGKKLAQVPLPV
ncbi:MAG: glycosyltransferase [Alloprevotella sp.]|nr:glycosyltransferase [Alloprevotella sp.]